MVGFDLNQGPEWWLRPSSGTGWCWLDNQRTEHRRGRSWGNCRCCASKVSELQRNRRRGKISLFQ